MENPDDDPEFPTQEMEVSGDDTDAAMNINETAGGTDETEPSLTQFSSLTKVTQYTCKRIYFIPVLSAVPIRTHYNLIWFLILIGNILALRPQSFCGVTALSILNL